MKHLFTLGLLFTLGVMGEPLSADGTMGMSNTIIPKGAPHRLLGVAECALTYSAADQAFMFLGASFVFLQIPGGALAQAGMLRRKNSLSIIMQTFTGFIIGSLLWWVIGFSLTFGDTQGGVIGNPGQYLFWKDLGGGNCFAAANSISGECFALFQMFFAIMVPVICCGAWAEKMRFEASCIFFAVWPFLTYYPLAHAVWGGGWLYDVGTQDFAGGVTIHTVAGTASIVIAKMMRKRANADDLDKPHDIPLVCVGGTFIIVGWFFFNGASTFAATPLAASVFANTYFASCTSGLTWMYIAWRGDHHFHMTEILNGMLAGLAGVTPASGFIDVWAAVVLGVIVGVLSYYFCRYESSSGLDDVLDVASLQGIPGMTGSILVGFFGNSKIGGKDGLLFGGGVKLLGAQLIGVAFSACWTAAMTALTMKLIGAVTRVQLSAEEEELGLDEIEYEAAYDTGISLDDVCAYCREGNLKALNICIEQGGFDWNSSDYDSRTPLHVAASENQSAVVKFLVDTAPDVDVDPTDRWGNTPALEAMKVVAASTGSSPDETAKTGPAKEIVRTLFEKGAKLADSPALGQMLVDAATKRNTVGLKAMISIGGGIDLSQCANQDGRTPLMVAASAGDLETVKSLIDTFQAMGPALLKEAVTAMDRQGSTAAQEARKAGQEETAKFLSHISAGGAANAAKEDMIGQDGADADDGLNMQEMIGKLCFYAGKGDVAGVKGMVQEHGKRVLALTDYDRRGALMLCCAEGHYALACYLVEMGMPVDRKDRFGKTCFDALVFGEKYDERIQTLLKSKGAKLDVTKLGGTVCDLVNQQDVGTLSRLVKACAPVDASKGGSNPIATCGDYDNRTGLHIACARANLQIATLFVQCGAKSTMKDAFDRTPADELTAILKSSSANPGKKAAAVQIQTLFGAVKAGSPGAAAPVAAGAGKNFGCTEGKQKLK